MTELLTRCAACSAEFLVSGNRAHPSPLRELLIGKSKSTDELLGQSALVRCPECGNAFPSNDVRFFGFLSPSGTRVVLLLFVTGFAALAIYFAIAQQ